ncbi:13889_t:CDS:2 [Entrophospora sp. SA101]|nr:12054_t:CDS:2 [Entrophospora sp. SA101]CAJ0841407.1 1072_t:CDS:2 [Entrophospora sp. SA101]CAJ0907043.1 13889_t:CDS:2 [Entrophospora sp. SA101]
MRMSIYDRDPSDLKIIDNSNQNNFSAFPLNNNNDNFFTLALTNNFPQFVNILMETPLVPDGNHMMSLITTTPLLNDPPSSFSCENNNNIVWILSRLEKRIDQIETSRNQRTFVKDNLSQNNALMAFPIILKVISAHILVLLLSWYPDVLTIS